MPSFGIDPAEIHQRASQGCPSALKDLAIDCCHADYRRRPTARQVLERLRIIEKDVLLYDDKTIKDPAEKAYHIGSMNFGGKLKTKKQISKTAGPGRIPSFEGQVEVPSNSYSSASDSSDEAVEDILKALEDIHMEGGSKTFKSKEDPWLEDSATKSYSNFVVSRKSKVNASRHCNTSSVATIKAAHNKYEESADYSFPLLPSSWLANADPGDVAVITGTHGEARSTQEETSFDEDSTTRTSHSVVEKLPFAFTSMTSLKGRVPSIGSTTAATVNGAVEERLDVEIPRCDDERDIFFPASSRIDQNLHRFSLAKPGWRLFSNRSTTAAIGELKALQKTSKSAVLSSKNETDSDQSEFRTSRNLLAEAFHKAQIPSYLTSRECFRGVTSAQNGLAS